jgi:hypothetical protein
MPDPLIPREGQTVTVPINGTPTACRILAIEPGSPVWVSTLAYPDRDHFVPYADVIAAIQPATQ